VAEPNPNLRAAAAVHQAADPQVAAQPVVVPRAAELLVAVQQAAVRPAAELLAAVVPPAAEQLVAVVAPLAVVRVVIHLRAVPRAAKPEEDRPVAVVAPVA
jgi:hypothetical protein